MIITCEQCHARYLLASLLLGVSGRKVRCGVCGHEWYQEPVDEPYTRESADAASFHDMVEQESLEPIPEGVKPIPEGSNVPVLRSETPPGVKKAARGAMAAAIVFLLLSGALLAVRGQVVQIWPPAALAFELAGFPTPVPGEGLIFDQVSATAKPDENGKYILLVEGNIINLRSKESAVPQILATLLKAEGEAGDSWRINPAQTRIGPEQTIPFTATFDGLPDDMEEVNVRFVLK